jgi:penicillin-binding protein 1A
MKKQKFGVHVLQMSAITLLSAYFLVLSVYKILELPYFQKPHGPDPTIYFADDGKTVLNPFTHAEKGLSMAPYFRESLREEINTILQTKNKDGSLKYQHPDGRAWNIYTDSLKAYTTLNVEMQMHAELAVKRHLRELQPSFHEQLKLNKHFPYSNDVPANTVARLRMRNRQNSSRYIKMTEAGKSPKEIRAAFNKPVKMKVFDWSGEKDTILSPNDSIAYYKSFLHAGLLSIEPQTGQVKAWVGGADIEHFAYDHVRQGRRQIGSAIKPFVFATAMAMGKVDPCTSFSGSYCVGNWCPGGKLSGSVADAIAYTSPSGSPSIAALSLMGSKTGINKIARLLADVNINLPPEHITPPMVLGTMDLSLFEITAAYSIFATNGVFNTPKTIQRIEDKNGNIIYKCESFRKEVLGGNVAYAMLKMLEGTINRGNGKKLRAKSPYGGIIYPTAGKTGTTQNYADNWFIGLTPDLVTGVWVGAEDRSIRWKWSGGGQGVARAIPIYGYYMNRMYEDTKIKISKGDFKKPQNYDPLWPDCLKLLNEAQSGKGKDGNYYFKENKPDSDNPFL